MVALTYCVVITLFSLLQGSAADVGSPDAAKGQNPTEKPSPTQKPAAPSKSPYPARTLFVQTIDVEPYSFIENGTTKRVGFIHDLLKAIQTRTNLVYVIDVAKPPIYGSKVGGTWTGLIGQVVKMGNCYDSKAPDLCHDQRHGRDIAAAPITITAAREQAVSFVWPFQNEGLSILVRKPYTMATDTPSFWPANFHVFSPVATEIWVLIIISCLVVGLTLWLMNKFNPYEWGGRENLGHATEAQAEAFSLSGSIWFAFTTLQWQGFERAPRSMASKFLTSIWFIFVTITLATYTGSLLNNLFWASTVHGKDPTKPLVIDLEHMVSDEVMDYGVVKGSATYNYIKNSQDSKIVYKKMMKHWSTEKGKESLVANTSAGLAKLNEKKNKFALIMETMQAKHFANKFYNFALRSYGFVVPKSAPFLADLNRAILELHELGEIERLEEKWFIGHGQCSNITKVEKLIRRQSALYINQPKQVNLQMFWGPMVLILVGIILSYAVAVGEIMHFKYHGRYQPSNRPGGQQLKLDEDGNI